MGLCAYLTVESGIDRLLNRTCNLKNNIETAGATFTVALLELSTERTSSGPGGPA
jgi:hypothetical protein